MPTGFASPFQWMRVKTVVNNMYTSVIISTLKRLNFLARKFINPKLSTLNFQL
jgi:hypothetical protein